MRASRIRPALAATATAALLVGGLAACGSDTGTDEPEVASQSSSSGDTEAADLPAEGDTVDPDEFAGWMKDGLGRSTTAKTSVSTDYGMGAIEGEGQVDYTKTPVEMAMTMSGAAMGGSKIDMRLVEGVMYMNLGSSSNNKFVKFDLDDPDSLPPGMAGLGDQLDPLAAFEDFGPALDEVVYVGNEDVDGEDLDHFAVTMDTSKIPAMQDLPAQADVPETVDYDLWFDDDFRMRVMKMSMDMAMQVDVEAKLYDWDEPVDIAAPDPEDITDAPVTMAG